MWYIPLLVLGVGADLNARTNNTTIDEKADIIVKSDILRPSGRLLNVFNVVRWCSYSSNDVPCTKNIQDSTKYSSTI